MRDRRRGSGTVAALTAAALVMAACSGEANTGASDEAARGEGPRTGESERSTANLVAPDAVEVPDGGIPLDVLAPQGSGAAPVTVGVPVPAASGDGPYRVASAAGPVPTQTAVQTDLGTEGLTWLLVDFQAEAGTAYWLEAGEPPPPEQPLAVSTVGGQSVIDSGAASWTVAESTDLLSSVTVDGEPVITGAGFDSSADASVEVTARGPVRAQAVVRSTGALDGLGVIAHLDFYSGLPYARVRITTVNLADCLIEAEAPPEADNGPNENGTEANQPSCNGVASANGASFEDLSWGVSVEDPTDGEELIYQDSSGGERWDFYRGETPRMQSSVEFRGFERTVDGETAEAGDVADGVLASGAARLDVPWFRELFPKALRRSGDRLEVGLFPAEYGSAHILRAGEQKTHDVFVGVDPERTPAWPVYASPDQAWLNETRALGPLPPVESDAQGAVGDYERYVAAQLDAGAFEQDECNNNLDDCARSLPDTREHFDYYGWTDFGDIPTDFESPQSPYNLKYDANLGFLLQAIRGDDPIWWEWAAASNIHYADIDILHSPVNGIEHDRAWWQGGTFGHSYHDEMGIHNPHRNYANPNPDTYWGGSGLAAYALITGDPVVRDAAIELADNVLWRITNSSDTGCDAKAWGGGNGEGYAVLEANARAVANSTRIFVWAYRLTGDTAYLDAAGSAAEWYDCESETLDPCASWKEALLARAIAEYTVTAASEGAPVHPSARQAVIDLAEALRQRLTTEGDRAWLVDCEDYAEINAWGLLLADVFTYAAELSGDDTWLDDADRTFAVGATDPYYEGDGVQYHTAKELVNVVDDGLVYIAAGSAGIRR